MELNPDHPVTKKVHHEWHKIAALLMAKFKQTSVEITEEDVRAFANCGTTNIVIKAGKTIKLSLVDDVTALRLSEEEKE